MKTKKEKLEYLSPMILTEYQDVYYGVIASSHEGLDDGDDIFGSSKGDSHEDLFDDGDLF